MSKRAMQPPRISIGPKTFLASFPVPAPDAAVIEAIKGTN